MNGTFAGFLPFWLLLAPVVLVLFDGARTPRRRHHLDHGHPAGAPVGTHGTAATR